MWTREAVLTYFGTLLDEADILLEKKAKGIEVHYTDTYKTRQEVNSHQLRLATNLLKDLLVNQIEYGK